MSILDLKKIAILGLAWPLVSHGQTVFDESFEEPVFSIGDKLNTIEGWTGNDSGNEVIVAISGGQASRGSQSVYLADNSETTRAQLVHDFGENITNGYVEFDIRPDSSATAYYVYFYDQGTYNTNFFLAISSKFTFGITGAEARSAPFIGDGYRYDPTAQEWHTFRVGFDEGANTAYVTVDGHPISGLSIASGDSDSTQWQAGRMAIITGSNAATGVAAYIDNISARWLTPQADTNDELKSQLDVTTEKINVVDESAYRVLFIGNSITRHGFSEDTKERLGWDHLAGMAASDASRDYCHLLGARIQTVVPEERVALYYHPYGGGGSVQQRLSTLDKVAVCKPNLVVIQLGEHEKFDDDGALLRKQYAQLIDELQAFETEPAIIAIGPWNTSQARDEEGHYLGQTGTVDMIMREVCLGKNVPYVSTANISSDRSTFGWGTHRGVQWHPNDAGHEGYADALFVLFNKVQSK